MKQLYFIIISLLISSISFAQSFSNQVIGSAGESVKASSAQLSYTLGESVTLTANSTSTAHLTQGFIQPELNSSVSVISPLIDNLLITTYPNPVNDVLHIKSSLVKDFELQYTITDITGKVISSGSLNLLNQSISTQNLAASQYFLNLSNLDNGIYKTVRFVKI